MCKLCYKLRRCFNILLLVLGLALGTLDLFLSFDLQKDALFSFLKNFGFNILLDKAALGPGGARESARRRYKRWHEVTILAFASCGGGWCVVFLWWCWEMFAVHCNTTQ